MGIGVAAFGREGVEWGFCSGKTDGSATTAFCKLAANGPKVIPGDALSQIPGNGFAPIAISWIASPIIAGTIAATMFVLTRLTILDDNVLSKLIYGKGNQAENSFFRALIITPFVYGFIASILSASCLSRLLCRSKFRHNPPPPSLPPAPAVVVLAVKGSSSSSGAIAGALSDADKSNNFAATLAGIAGGTGAVITVLAFVYVSLWQYRKNWVGEDLKDWEYLHFFVLAKRPIREGFDETHVKTSVEGKFAITAAVGVENLTVVLKPNLDLEALAAQPKKVVPAEILAAQAVAEAHGYKVTEVTIHEKIMANFWNSFTTGTVQSRVKSILLAPFRFVFCYGLLGDDGAEREVRTHGALEQNVAAMHKLAYQYDDRSELVFRQLQMMTSCIASFSHGSNDVANAMGPLSAILGVYRCTPTYSSGKYTGCSSPGTPGLNIDSKTGIPKPWSAANGWEVPTWLLAVGGIMIGIGFCTYGFHLMRVLGNNLTYHSPSRGYCMEMGAAITVLIASRIGLPISTTQCITGATMAVGLLNGARGVNWKRFSTIFLSWLVTMPLVGLISGLMFTFMASNPTFMRPVAA